MEWETRENKGEKCGLDIEFQWIAFYQVQFNVFLHIYIPIECTSEIALFIHHEIWLIAICIFSPSRTFFLHFIKKLVGMWISEGERGWYEKPVACRLYAISACIKLCESFSMSDGLIYFSNCANGLCRCGWFNGIFIFKLFL